MTTHNVMNVNHNMVSIRLIIPAFRSPIALPIMIKLNVNNVKNYMDTIHKTKHVYKYKIAYLILRITLNAKNVKIIMDGTLLIRNVFIYLIVWFIMKMHNASNAKMDMDGIQ